jgi:hypothetical protein
MPANFEKFTERARHALTFAQEEAKRFQHDYVGTEHLLLGVVRETDGVGARVLADLGANADRVRSAVEMQIGKGDRTADGEVGLIPRAKAALKHATDEAQQLRHSYIGTEHLALGLLYDEEAVSCRVLNQLGISLERAREAVVLALSAPAPLPLDRWAALAPGGISERGLRRYSLVLPETLFAEVQRLADAEQTTVVELLRRFIKLGLLASRIADTPGSALIIREGDREREILMI